MDATTIDLGDAFLDYPEAARGSVFDRGYRLGNCLFETLRDHHGADPRGDTIRIKFSRHPLTTR